MSTFQLTSIAILILSLINTAHAHYVWLERDGEGSAYAYFGEWVDDIREKAGGLLDRIKAPRAFLGASTTPLPIKRHEDKLEIKSQERAIFAWWKMAYRRARTVKKAA